MGSATTPTTVSTATMPTSMTDAEATRLGLKQYLVNTAYAATPVVTVGTNVTTLGAVSRGVLIPYQMQDGSWRLRVNIAVAVTAATSATSHRIALSGITTKNVAAFAQTILIDTASGGNYERSGCDEGSNTFLHITTGSSTPTVFRISGDIELDSKPTWAY